MPEPTYPKDLRYHEEHGWARIDGDRATFGITWYAQNSLGEVIFYEGSEVGVAVQKDSAYAEVESVKAISNVIAPLSGEVTAVNPELGNAPERINEDPYGQGWTIMMRLSAPSEAEVLLDAAQYRKLVEGH